jgi:hypothetical protein
MGDTTRPGFKVVTVIRGTCAPSPVAVGPQRGPHPAPLMQPLSDVTATTVQANVETIYGVPVSAVQHCCGRGCKHCRIYWHRMKP